jgi:hypothetical protein
MLPPLTAAGLLPLGVHTAPLSEVLAAFGVGNPVRRDLAERLQLVLRLAEETAHLKRAFVWGSFVTIKPEPGDIDVMLVMSDQFRSELCSPSVRNVFDGEAAERLLGATVLWTREDVPEELLNAFLEQWQIDRDGRRRGIVEVLL